MSGTRGGLLALLLVGVLALTGCEEDGVNRVNFPDRGPGTTLLYRETQKLQEELAQIVQENDLDLVVDSATEGSYVRASFDIEEMCIRDSLPQGAGGPGGGSGGQGAHARLCGPALPSAGPGI